MTPKQLRFIGEYLTDLNATQAAIRAGYSRKRADAIGYENLRKPEIVAAISERMKDREQRTEVTQDKTLRELARIAFFDPRALFRSDGAPIPIAELDADTAAAIASFDVGLDGSIKYRFCDKNSALDKLAKHLGMYEKHNQQKNPLEGVPRDVLKTISERLIGLATR